VSQHAARQSGGGVPWVVVDPALGRTGAHNTAIAMMLAEEGLGGSLGFCTNVAASAECREELRQGGAHVHPVFDVDFYALTDKPGTAAEHWEWIQRLASNYLSAFEWILARWPALPVNVLHHTLSWEHANALALANAALGERGRRIQHVVLLMFSPGVRASGDVIDAVRLSNFRIAFNLLRASGRVQLHAACAEYAQAYAHLLELATALPVHPCLVGNRAARVARPRERVPKVTLLYVGEVKADKGVLDLPRRLRECVGGARPDQRFIVHFSAVRTDAAKALLSELQGIAREHPEVEVHSGFWSEAELNERLASADLLCLDYDPTVYADKTSGLLWLAAWHYLPVLIPRQGWLAREAKALGMELGDQGPRVRAEFPQIGTENPYFKMMFAPLQQWMQQLPVDAAALSPSAAATLSRKTPEPAPESGADIVLFWKQNDSTVYGHRNDMIARYLASRPDVRRVLMLDAPISTQRLASMAANRDSLRHDQLLAERTMEKLAGKWDSGKIVHSVFVHDASAGQGFDQDRPSVQFLDAYECFLREQLRWFGMEPAKAVFWLFPRCFSVPSLVSRMHPARVVVDVVDDHRAWPGVSPDEIARLDRHYRHVLSLADLALSNCEPIREGMAALGCETQVLLNGCDAPLAVVPGDVDPRLQACLDRGGSIIGFVGNLESKIDVALLERLAEVLPHCQLVLVGSTHANPSVLALQRYPNVHFPGVVSHDRLGPWLKAFTVGIIPHLRMDLTRYMNPLKAYVYLANGVPVVATGVPNIEPVPGLLTVTADQNAFVDAVVKQLAIGRPPQSRFDEVVARHGWSQRLGPVVDGLNLAEIPGAW
jgi:hypothetical protein